jgi:hypothetical protein
MKKLLLSASLTPAYLLLAKLSFAADPVKATRIELCPQAGGNFAGLCNFTPANAIPAIISFIFVIAIIVALFYLIWGGFKWLISGGDKTAVGAAREHIIAAIIGLVIIFLAYFILNILLGFFIPGQEAKFFDLPSINSAPAAK